MDGRAAFLVAPWTVRTSSSRADICTSASTAARLPRIAGPSGALSAAVWNARAAEGRSLVKTNAVSSQAADEDDDDDDDDDDLGEVDGDADGFVTVVDHETGRSIECYVERTLTVKSVDYFLCAPCDDPVVLAVMEGDGKEGEGELTTIEDQERLDKLYPVAADVLAEDNYTLQNSAFVWTVIGDVAEDDDDDDESDGDDGDGEDVGDVEDDEDFEPSTATWNNEEEDVEVISEFFHEGVEYFVAKTVAPVLFVARQTERGYEVPDTDELDRVTPLIEEQLEND